MTLWAGCMRHCLCLLKSSFLTPKRYRNKGVKAFITITVIEISTDPSLTPILLRLLPRVGVRMMISQRFYTERRRNMISGIYRSSRKRRIWSLSDARSTPIYFKVHRIIQLVTTASKFTRKPLQQEAQTEEAYLAQWCRRAT